MQAPEKHLCQFHPPALRDSELSSVKGSWRARGWEPGDRGAPVVACAGRRSRGRPGPHSLAESQLAGRTGLTASGARRTLRKGKAEAPPAPSPGTLPAPGSRTGEVSASQRFSSALWPRRPGGDIRHPRPGPAGAPCPATPPFRARPGLGAWPGGFVGPPRRLCRASPRACAGGARRGAGRQGPRRKAGGTAPGGGWRSGGQRTGSAGGLSRGCALLGGRRCGKVGLGAPLSLCSPRGLWYKGLVYSQKGRPGSRG